MRDADRIIGLLLEKKEMNAPKLVINRIRQKMVKRGEMLDVDDIVSILAIDLLGIIPDDEAVIKSANEGEPS